MSVEDVKRLYEAIGEDRQLQSEFEGLESRDEIIAKLLGIANRRELDVSRSDVEAFVEKFIDDDEPLGKDQLEDVAGGSSADAGMCNLLSCDIFSLDT